MNTIVKNTILCFTDNHWRASNKKDEEVNLLHLKIKRIILFCKRCILDICVSFAKNKMEAQNSRCGEMIDLYKCILLAIVKSFFNRQSIPYFLAILLMTD